MFEIQQLLRQKTDEDVKKITLIKGGQNYFRLDLYIENFQ